MNSDALMPLSLIRSGAAQRRSSSHRFAGNVAFPRSRLALVLVLAIASACKSCSPAGGASNGAGAQAGSSASITVSPAVDVHIGPLDEFDPESLHRTYVLANAGAESRSWEARVSQPWLSLAGPSRGTLAPGESVEVPVHVDLSLASEDGLEFTAGDVVFVERPDRPVLATRTVTIASTFVGPGSDGWTRLGPSPDTRTVYVSSGSGNDQSDGLSTSTPKRTLAAAAALLRHGFPDWLLLKRGDVWHESLGQWKKSGRSANEPMVVSAYGSATARPLLKTGTVPGIRTNGGGGSPATIDNLALVGLHFHANGYTGGGGCIGAQMLQPGSHILIEDCKFEGYSTNLVFQGFGGRHTDFRLRRSVIVDAYSIHAIGGHSQGLYAYAVDGLLIEENVFDHNGWNEGVPGAGADIYSHNLYIDNDNTNVVVRGNIIANASSHGMQLRPGGSAVGNLFLRNSISLSVGGGNNPEPGGVTAEVRGNVILDGKNIDAANPRGWGMWFGNVSSGHVAYNVIANNTLGTQPNVMTLDGQFVGDTGPTLGVRNLMIERNIIFNWGGSILVRGSSSQITNVTFDANDVQNTSWPTSLLECPVASGASACASSGNRFYCQPLPASAWTVIASIPQPIGYWFSLVGDATSAVLQVPYPDPLRSAGSYNASVGGAATLAAFLTEARLQSRTNWRPAYTAVRVNRYIRRGF